MTPSEAAECGLVSTVSASPRSARFGSTGRRSVHRRRVETDLTRAGTKFRPVASTLIEQVVRTLGHVAEGLHLRMAAEQAHRYGFFLWEVFALRDWLWCLIRWSR